MRQSFDFGLRAGLEMKQRDRDRQFLLFSEVHEDWNDPSVVGRDAAVIAKENFGIAGKRRLVDLVIDECVPAIDAARQRELRQRAFSITPIIKYDVYRAVDRIDGHPCEKLHLGVLQK